MECTQTASEKNPSIHVVVLEYSYFNTLSWHVALNKNQIYNIFVVDIVSSKMYKVNTNEGGHPVMWEWHCTDCSYTSAHGTNMKNHIESNHVISGGYNCLECGKNVPTRNALRMHMARNHPIST